MPGIPEVLDTLDRIKAIHQKKNEDYSADGKPFENFERSAEIASWFGKKEDIPFATLIGTKLARLATLLNSDKTPNNESIDDSFDDLATYSILWGAMRKRMRQAVVNSPKEKTCPTCRTRFYHSGYISSGNEYCCSQCVVNAIKVSSGSLIQHPDVTS